MLPEIYQNNPIVNHSFEFALLIDTYCFELRSNRKYELAGQLFRSGTSIGANVWEAQEAESRADFIHKMKLSAKEARESYYWLLICQNGKDYPAPDELLKKLEEIRRLLSSIIASAKRNRIRQAFLAIFPFF